WSCCVIQPGNACGGRESPCAFLPEVSVRHSPGSTVLQCLWRLPCDGLPELRTRQSPWGSILSRLRYALPSPNALTHHCSRRVACAGSRGAAVSGSRAASPHRGVL